MLTPQDRVNAIREHALALEAEGYDCGDTFENMMDINRVLPRPETTLEELVHA